MLPAGLASVVAATSLVAAMPASAAAPRLPQETQVRHPPPVTPGDMEVWLRRLVGRFRWEGTLDTSPLEAREDGTDLIRVHGLGDCVAVGKGPGVQCVLNVQWQESWTFEGTPVAVPNLTPAMNLYGIDAVRERFVYLQVDNKGLALGGPGTLRGATGTLRAPCIGTNLPLLSPDARESSAAVEGENPGSESSGGESSGGESPNNQAPGGTATYSPAPINSVSDEPGPWMGCLWTTHIVAQPGRNVIFVNIDYGDRFDPTNRFTLTLRRVSDPGAR